MKLPLSTFLICAFLSTLTKAQDTNLKLEVNYPITLGEFKNEYAGLVDVGAKYLFLEQGPVNLGVSVNGGLLKNSSNSQFNSELDLRIISFQPRIAAEFTSLKSLNLYPQIGVGYSMLFFRNERTPPLEPEKWNERGINLNLGLIYQLNSTFFIQAQYDYLNVKSFGLLFGNMEANRKTSGGFFKVGIGIDI